MTLKTLHIVKPSAKLVTFVRRLQSEKEAKLKQLDADRENYFGNKK